MKTVTTTTDPTEAALLVALLGQEGIEAHIEGEGGAYGAVGLPSPAAPLEIAVAEKDVVAASKVIHARYGKHS